MMSVTAAPLIAPQHGWIRIAKQRIDCIFGTLDERLTETKPTVFPPALQVQVILRSAGRVRATGTGDGASLQEQVENATARALVDTRHGDRLVRGELQFLSVEVWIQNSSSPMSQEDLANPSVISVGYDGLEIRTTEVFAQLLPIDAIVRQLRTPLEMISALCLDAGLSSDAWLSPEVEIRKTIWMHLVESEEAPSGHAMHGLRRIQAEPVTESQLKSWIELGAQWLCRNQHSDGSYSYIYHTITGSDLPAPLNKVRAAGCVYGMAWAASTVALDKVSIWETSARQAADALLRRSVLVDESGGLMISEGDGSAHVWGKLGTVALLGLGLTFPALRQTYAGTTERLITTIRGAQRDDGTFACCLGKQEEPSQIDYFPGQALLLLAKEAASGDRDAADRCRRAFTPYRDHFRSKPQRGFVLWQADAWSRLALLEQNEEYAGFVFEIVDWILRYQHGGDAPMFCRGGFSFTGSVGVSTTVYGEAVVRALHLARKLGDSKREARYKDSALAALEFSSRLRIGLEHRAFVADFARAEGAVTSNLFDFKVRCDNVQHLMTFALAVLEVGDIA